MWSYLSYEGDRGRGFYGSMQADLLVLTKTLRAWKVANRPTAAMLRNNPGVKDYPYDSDLKIYEYKLNLDWMIDSESDSDGDSLSRFDKSSEKYDNKQGASKDLVGKP